MCKEKEEKNKDKVEMKIERKAKIREKPKEMTWSAINPASARVPPCETTVGRYLYKSRELWEIFRMVHKDLEIFLSLPSSARFCTWPFGPLVK